MATTEYARQQLVGFFRILDTLLESPATITVIGGTAIILGYKINRGTIDIDPWGSVVADIQKNWDKAVKQSGVDVKLDMAASVAQGPYDFENRLIVIGDLKLKKLKIFYPEAHDLVLMKITRNVDIDAADIDALHKKEKLKEKILLERYLEEVISIYVGDSKDLDLKYLATIERLYGELIAETHKLKIARRRA